MIHANDFWSDIPRGDVADPSRRDCAAIPRHYIEAMLSIYEERPYVPRQVFAERVGHIEELAGLRIPSRSALAALFTRYLADISAARPALTEVEAKARMDEVLLLFAAIVPAQAPSEAITDVPQASEQSSGGLLVRAERCINAALGEHEFDAAALAQMLGVSRSRLYSAFVPRGGVSAAIRNARLDRARLRFASPDDRHRTQAEVAYACGFTDYPSFSRAFRRRYGTSPRDARSR